MSWKSPHGWNGYSRYRGRSMFHTPLKILAILLAAALALAVVGLLLAEPYWVYSADGARLRLPWAAGTEEEESAPPLLPTPSQSLVLLTPEPVASEPLHAVLLPVSALTDGTAQTRLTQAGGTAALFDMKGDDGDLAFVSAAPMALNANVNAGSADINAAIQSLNAQEGLYTVARLSCFRDNTMPRYRNDLALRSSGGNWLDSDGIRWLSLAYQENREYIIQLCLELAGLGFDEILLDHAAFPVDGKVENIRAGDAYDAALLAAQTQAFYTDLAARLEAAYPEVRLSVVADPAALTPAGSVTGQSLELAAAADRIWVRDMGTGRDSYEALLEQAGLESPQVNLVSILDQAGGQEQSWALWT